jgi:hypothetical protein
MPLNKAGFLADRFHVAGFLPAGDEDSYGQEENGGHDALRPEAVDAPFLHNVGFEVAEEAGAQEANLCGFKEQPPASGEREDGDQGVADDADGGYGDVLCAGGFVEGFGGEDGEAAVVDCAAVKVCCDRAGRCEAGVHVMDVQCHRRNDDACNCE